MQKGKHKRIILGAWNVRTLLNRAITSRPERGTAHVARKSSRTQRNPDCGRGLPERSGRWLHLLLERLNLLTSSDDAKEQFYEQFDKVIRSTQPSDKQVILGDFNARVGRDYSSWEGVLGRHRVGKINDNGLLLSKCAEHSLCITNALFRMADKYKTTWMHPRSKHWHLIDFIIVRQWDVRDVRVTRAMRGAECWTDHRLVRAVLTLHIVPPHGNRPKTVRAAYNVARLKDPSYRARFQ